MISLFLFWFWEVARCQFPGAVPSLRSSAGLDEEKSCDVDFENELLPELTDSPGTTRGTKLSVLHIIVFSSLVYRGFLTADPLVGISVVFAEFSQRQNCKRFFE